MTVYGWADPNSFSGTVSATLMNGFMLGVAPRVYPDYNHNRTVDAADYVLLRKGVAGGDYATWRAHFGERDILVTNLDQPNSVTLSANGTHWAAASFFTTDNAAYTWMPSLSRFPRTPAESRSYRSEPTTAERQAHC